MGSFGHFYLRIAKIAAGRNFVFMKKSDLYRVPSNCNVRGGVAMDSIWVGSNYHFWQEIVRADSRNVVYVHWSVAVCLFCVSAFLLGAAVSSRKILYPAGPVHNGIDRNCRKL